MGNGMRPNTVADAARLELRKERQRQRLSVKKVADRMGLSRPFLTQMESNNRRMSVERLCDYCDAIGVSPASIFSRATRAMTEGRRNNNGRHT